MLRNLPYKIMKRPLVVNLILGIFMLSAGILTKVITPSIQPEVRLDNINLEAMIPRKFGSWKIDPSTVDLMVNPDDKGLLNNIYNQTLSRTYINNGGERVMLSIAYGRDQSRDLHVHRPEICYTASGFDIGKMSKATIHTAIGSIPVMRLVATQSTRNEPITYWIRLGDSLTRGWFEQKWTAITHSLSGKVPDGLLFRVSSISKDENQSFSIQQEFLSGMLLEMKREDRYWLVGKLTP
jgi:EpsI family protein